MLWRIHHGSVLSVVVIGLCGRYAYLMTGYPQSGLVISMKKMVVVGRSSDAGVGMTYTTDSGEFLIIIVDWTQDQ